MTRPLHLLALWNPAYSGDALDVHLSLLLEWSRRHGAGQAEADDVYVWWGKIRSKNREGRVEVRGATKGARWFPAGSKRNSAQ